MPCALGLDTGMTATIGVRIRLLDRMLGLASPPAAPNSQRVGRAEEPPEPCRHREIDRRLADRPRAS
jgi:hypothetical protein